MILFILFFLIHSAYAEPGGKITGKVIDKETREGIGLAHVMLDNGQGTITKSDGTFELFLKPGQYSLSIRHIGYHIVDVEIHLQKDQTVDTLIVLTPRVIPLQGVSVSAEHWSGEISQLLTPTATVINPRFLYSMPTAGGADLFRALQMTPSVSQSNELTSRIYVRGSSCDQNLILFDDIELFNPYHLFGMSSNFNPDAVGEAILLPGGFSVKFGNRLGSVLDIHSKKPDTAFSFSAHSGFINSGLAANGHLGKRIGYTVAWRKNHYDLLSKLTDQIKQPYIQKLSNYLHIPYQYSDRNAKVIIKPNSNHSATFSIFKSSDLYDNYSKTQEHLYLGEPITNPYEISLDDFYPYESIRRYALHWENKGYAIKWTSNFGNWGEAKIIFSQSSANDWFERWWEDRGILNPAPPGYEEAIEESNKLHQQKIERHTKNRLEYKYSKAQFSLFPTQWLITTIGAKMAIYKMNYHWTNLHYDVHWMPYMDNPPSDFKFLSRMKETAYFMETIWQPNPLFTISIGLRLNRWNLIGKWHADPRVNFRYTIKDNLSCNLAMGRFSQSIATARESGLFTPIDLYFPCSIVGHAERAEHFILSFDYTFESILRLSLAMYHKNFKNLLTRYNEESVFNLQSGYARGLEIKADYDLGWTHGYMAYTLSNSIRNLNGYRYPSNYDQRHRAVIFGCINLGRNWSLDLNWEFHSGQPYDPGVYRAPFLEAILNLDTMEPMYTGTYTMKVENIKRGAIRHPYYHRLDLGFTKKFHFHSWTVSPYFRILNAYWRKNVLYYDQLYYEYPGIPNPYQEPTLIRRVNYLPTIPTFGIRIEFR